MNGRGQMMIAEADRRVEGDLLRVRMVDKSGGRW